MSKLQYLSVLIAQRLTLVAQEIFKDVEETISEFQEENKLAKIENAKLKLKLRQAGIDSCDESREAVTPAERPAEVRSSGEQRQEVVYQDGPSVASVKQELDALAEVDPGSVDSGQRGSSPEPVAMQIKIEANFTECTSLEKLSDHCPQSDVQTATRATVNIANGVAPSGLEQQEVFPCVERAWSVRESSILEPELQDSAASQSSGKQCLPRGQPQQNMSRSRQKKDATQERDDEDDDDDDGREDVMEVDHTDTITDTPRSRNEDCPSEDDDNDCDDVDDYGDVEEGGDFGEDDHDLIKKSKNIDEAKLHKPEMPQKRPRGRPRKHPLTSTPKPAQMDLRGETSRRLLRSGNKRTAVITRGLRGRHTKPPQTSTNKAAEVSNGKGRDSSKIGRPLRKSRMHLEGISKAKPDEVNLENEENTVADSNPVGKRPRGRPRKKPLSTPVKPAEVDLNDKDSVSEGPPISEDPKTLSRPSRTSGRLSKCNKTSTIQPAEMDSQAVVDLNDDEERVPGDPTISEDPQTLSGPSRTSGRLRHSQTSTIQPAETDSQAEADLDDEDSVSEEPAEVDLEDEECVSEEQPSCNDSKTLSRPSKTSGTQRKRSQSFTIQSAETSNQDGTSSDEASSGDDKDSLEAERPMKRRRASDSEFEMDEEDCSSDEESSYESDRDLAKKQRPKSDRLSRSIALEAGLDHVSVLTADMDLVKRQYCLYCEKPVIKVSRHLARHHYDQLDVIKALTLPKKSKERKIQLARIRNSGNRAHNNRVLKEGKGLLIPCRAFRSEDPKESVYCHGCHGMFAKESRHIKYCPFVTKEDSAGPSQEEGQPSCSVIKPKVAKTFAAVLADMHQDDVAEAVRGDKVVLKLGQLLFDKGHSNVRICQRVRELGRLLLNGRHITPLYKIEDYVMLSNWDHLAAAVKDVAGYCESTCTFAIPKYALNLRRSLHTLAAIVKCDAETSGDKEIAENAQTFQEHLLIRWHQQFKEPKKSSCSGPSMIAGEQTCSDGKDRGNGSEDTGTAELLRMEQEMERQKNNGIQVLPANQDEKAQLQNAPASTTEEERSGSRSSTCPPDDDLEKDRGDDSVDDVEADDADDEDDGIHDGDSEGDGLHLPSEQQDNTKNENLNSCDSARNDTLPKQLNQSQQQTKATGVTMSSLSHDQESVSGKKTAPEKSVASLPRSEDREISIAARRGKKHYCLYCKKPVSKISRHLEMCHYEHEDVAKAFRYPKLSKERKMHLQLLLRRGNRAHNVQVLKEGKGEIIPCKRGLGKPGDFLHCPYCDGLFLKRAMGVHLKKCPFAKDKDLTVSKTGKRGSVQALCLMGEPRPENVSKEFWKVLITMNQDNIAVTLRRDKYALRLGQQLIDKGQGDDAIHESYIRQRLRELGRLLISCQKISPMNKLEDFILPANWDHLVAVVKDVAGYNKTDSTPNPSILGHLYRSLQKIGAFVESDAVSLQDKEMAELASDFNRDFVKKWRQYFPAPFETTRSQQCSSSGTKLLTLTEDVKNLHTYLKDKLNECATALRKSPNQTTWRDTARLVLAQLILFNRKKADDVAKLTLRDFSSKEAYGIPDDADDLTTFERELCKFTCRIEISRSTGDSVHILVPPALTNIMETMFHWRVLCGVRYDNIYMFAVPQSLAHFLGIESLQRFATECGVKHVKEFVSNGLRTHIAMISRLLYMKDMHQVTEFMGLNLTAHLRNDCLQQETVELVKLGKVFTAMEKGLLKVPEQNVHEILVSTDETVQQADLCSAEEDEDDDEDYSPSKPNKPQHGPARRKGARRHKWNEAEVQAVERHMAKFITSGKTPGKKACTACIMAEPEALKYRKWQAIKFYTKNRITSLRRQSGKQS